MDYTPVTASEFAELEGLDGWRFLFGAIHTELRAGSFPAAGALVAAIADAAEAANHHPDLQVYYPDRVVVRLASHVTGAVTRADVELARTISSLAARAGATAESGAVQTVEIAIDTLDADRIRPFWLAVLDYEDRDGNLVDPRGVGPPLWFQQMGAPRTERQRFHLDISVPHDVAEARIEAALAAGGRLVTDEFARAWWVLADADGNEACICTWQDRD